MMEKIPQPNHLEKEKETLKQLVVGFPDAFCILAGPSRFDKTRGYVPSSFGIGDENSRLAIESGHINLEKLDIHLTPEEMEHMRKNGVPAGGNDRVIAVAKIHEVFPEAQIVTVTRPRNEDEPTYATIIEEELRRRGVKDDSIVSTGEHAVAVDTITEYKEHARLWREHGWKNIVFVLSAWHEPRAEALLNHIEDFVDNSPDGQNTALVEFVEAIRNGELTVQFLNTSAVLSASSGKYKRFFEEKLAHDPGMRLREAIEKSAVEDITSGTYGGKTLKHKIWEDKP